MSLMKSEQNRNQTRSKPPLGGRFKSDLDTCWKQCGQSGLKIGSEKEPDLNQIWIRFACSLNAALVLFYLVCHVFFVKILGRPGHGYKRRVELEATGLGCKYLRMFCFSFKGLLLGGSTNSVKSVIDLTLVFCYYHYLNCYSLWFL